MNSDAFSRRHPRIRWIGALSSAVPCFYLSWVLFNVWRDPMAWDDGNWVRLGVGLLLLEFVLLHSGAFISSIIAGKQQVKQRLKLLAGLMLFYTILVWGFAKSVDSTQLLWVFGGVSLGRLVTALTNAGEGSRAMMERSGFGVVIYLLVTCGTVFIDVPEWGISNSVLADVYPDRGSGLWERDPERAIAGAAVYFFLFGLAELLVLGRHRHTDNGQQPLTITFSNNHPQQAETSSNHDHQ
jgi:hypothetical protein